MTTDGRNILTHSRQACAKTCLRRHWYSYEFGIRKDKDTAPLRTGKAFHHAREEIGNGVYVDWAVNSATAEYGHFPAWCVSPEDQYDYRIEGEIVKQLILGYVARWGTEPLETVAVETPFDLPLTNPETGGVTPLWRLGGKIDSIVKLADGRLMVGELKTAGEDLSPDSDFWKRLRIDQQISLYTLAAIALGYDVKGILYDVPRKPLIRPRLLTQGDSKTFLASGDYFGKHFVCTDGPVLIDGEPCEIVPGAKAGSFAIRETVAMYGARIAADMKENPSWYFARMEIPRLQADLDEFRWELWSIQGLLRDCQRYGRWPRNTASCLRPYRCEFWDLCTGSYDTASGIVPEGYKKLEFVHPELQNSVAAELT